MCPFHVTPTIKPKYFLGRAFLGKVFPERGAEWDGRQWIDYLWPIYNNKPIQWKYKLNFNSFIERSWLSLTGCRHGIISGWMDYKCIESLTLAGTATFADTFMPTTYSTNSLWWLLIGTEVRECFYLEFVAYQLEVREMSPVDMKLPPLLCESNWNSSESIVNEMTKQ